MLLKRTLIVVMTVLFALSVCGCHSDTETKEVLPENVVTVDIDTSDIYYVRAFLPYIGSRNIYYENHKQTVDRLVEMIEGEYRYVDTYSIYGRSGDGAWGITLYDSNGDLIYTYSISYRDELMWLDSDKTDVYWRYEKADSSLDFDWFLGFLETMWEETY